MYWHVTLGVCYYGVRANSGRTWVLERSLGRSGRTAHTGGMLYDRVWSRTSGRSMSAVPANVRGRRLYKEPPKAVPLFSSLSLFPSPIHHHNYEDLVRNHFTFFLYAHSC